MSSAQQAAEPPLSVLLGIPSSVYARRAAARCSFRLQTFCARCRALFIVGASHTQPPPRDAKASDVLYLADVQEHTQGYLPASVAARRPSLTGTLTTQAYGADEVFGAGDLWNFLLKEMRPERPHSKKLRTGPGLERGPC